MVFSVVEKKQEPGVTGKLALADVPVSEGTRVVLNFELRLEDDAIVDSNFDGEPVQFVVGDGSLLPGFERALFGLKAGDRTQFTIAPEQGFGMPNENNVQRLARDRFDDADPQPGLVFSFAAADGGELPGLIVAVDEREVIVDFNHPLAGRTIVFEVEIHGVEPAELH